MAISKKRWLLLALPVLMVLCLIVPKAALAAPAGAPTINAVYTEAAGTSVIVLHSTVTGVGAISYEAKTTQGVGTSSFVSAGVLRISGLTSGTAYTFQVVATDANDSQTTTSANFGPVTAGTANVPVTTSAAGVDFTNVTVGGVAAVPPTAIPSHVFYGQVVTFEAAIKTGWSGTLGFTGATGGSPTWTTAAINAPLTLTATGIGQTITATPSNVKVWSNATNGAVTVTFDAVAGATGYIVEYGTDNITFASTQASVGAATNVTVTGLTPGSSYYFRVRATNAGGNSANASAGVAHTVRANTTAAGNVPFSLSGSNYGALSFSNIQVNGGAASTSFPAYVSWGDTITFQVAGLANSYYYSSGTAAIFQVNGTTIGYAAPTYTYIVGAAPVQLTATNIAIASGGVYYPPVTYSVTQHPGIYYGTGNAVFLTNGAYSSFSSLTIAGNKLVLGTDYTIANVNSGTQITINAAYLATLANGTHHVNIQFANGYVASTLTKSIGTTGGIINIPKTGDTVSPVGFAMIAAAFIAVGAIVAYRRKVKN